MTTLYAALKAPLFHGARVHGFFGDLNPRLNLRAGQVHFESVRTTTRSVSSLLGGGTFKITPSEFWVNSASDPSIRERAAAILGAIGGSASSGDPQFRMWT
jgi:hypothetical protein